MKIGFTGTQNGMSERQRKALVNYLEHLDRNYIITEFHHGGCIGADVEAENIASRFHAKIYVHPCDIASKQAKCIGEYLEVKKPLARNKDIIDAVELLVAAPKSHHEELRSGTWATIRYARKKNIKIVMLY